MTKLVLVPTPIGNLNDITYRAVSALSEADIILAEDTRKTGILLQHLKISKKLIPHHKFNEHSGSEYIVNQIKQGTHMALVSDAGTPGISDPGFLLVRACIEAGIDVECLPGPTAFIPALVVSGLPSDKFCFEGFLPVKKGRTKRLKELVNEERTMVFYESPFRIQKFLQQLSDMFGSDRKASVSRELTKIYEETLRGTLAELIEIFENKKVKGEIVVVVEGAKNR